MCDHIIILKNSSVQMGENKWQDKDGQLTCTEGIAGVEIYCKFMGGLEIWWDLSTKPKSWKKLVTEKQNTRYYSLSEN